MVLAKLSVPLTGASIEMMIDEEWYERGFCRISFCFIAYLWYSICLLFSCCLFQCSILCYITKRHCNKNTLYSFQWFFLYIYIFWIKYDFGQKYHTPQVRPDWGSNTWPPDHDCTFHSKPLIGVFDNPYLPVQTPVRRKSAICNHQADWPFYIHVCLAISNPQDKWCLPYILTEKVMVF